MLKKQSNFSEGAARNNVFYVKDLIKKYDTFVVNRQDVAFLRQKRFENRMVHLPHRFLVNAG